jgi:hypothetical protein
MYTLKSFGKSEIKGNLLGLFMFTNRTHPAWHGQICYRYLLWALVTLFAMYPMITHWFLGRLIELLATVVILVTGILAIYKSWSQIGFTVVVAIIYLTMGLTQIALNPERLLTVVWLVSGVVFFFHVTWTLMRDIFASQGSVTGDLLYGAVSVYLLIGLSFANGHFLLEKAIPGSYFCGSPQCAPFQTIATYVYYSFITLATVGYGEITPSSGIAGVMTYMKAITGQMYLAILVAQLVGMQISQSPK